MGSCGRFSCRNFLKTMPWASLAGVVLCCAGTLLFCAAGHEAVIISIRLLNSANVPGFVLRLFIDDELLSRSPFVALGISLFMVGLMSRHLASGRTASTIVKKDVTEGVNVSLWSRCHILGLLLMTLSATIVWSFAAAVFASFSIFFLLIYLQCSRNEDPSYGFPTCLDFSVTGLVFNINNDDTYGRLCGDNKEEFCNSFAFQLTYTLYLASFGGALLVIIGLCILMMIASANYIYMTKIPEISKYFEEDEEESDAFEEK